ncbi:MAG: hypothetical protein IPJ65_28760 [Archangiaceae bacterium]|nr:hypothetical protein [Archangiaceae bacterium]
MKRALLLICVLLTALTAGAATFLEATVEALTAHSDFVARVRVNNTRAVKVQNRIVTVAECEVLEVYKGRGYPTARVVTPGGEVDDYGMRVAGAAEFTVGEEAVLFLGRPFGGAWQVVGMEQGKWSIDSTGKATQGHTGHLVDPAGKPLARAPVAPLGLGELKARVRAAAVTR